MFAAPAPIHKSSSTGSFSLGQQSTSSTSSTFLFKPSQPDRSASFSFSAPKQQPPTTTGLSTFGSGDLFGKSSGSTPVTFSFGGKADEAKGGGKTPFTFVTPKAVPASTSLSQGGAVGLTEQGKLLQQPSSEMATKSLFQASPQAATSPGGLQQSGSLSSDHLKSQYPLSASSSAFSLSQQKTPSGANAFSGGKQHCLFFPKLTTDHF